MVVSSSVSLNPNAALYWMLVLMIGVLTKTFEYCRPYCSMYILTNDVSSPHFEYSTNPFLSAHIIHFGNFLRIWLEIDCIMCSNTAMSLARDVLEIVSIDIFIFWCFDVLIFYSYIIPKVFKPNRVIVGDIQSYRMFVWMRCQIPIMPKIYSYSYSYSAPFIFETVWCTRKFWPTRRSRMPHAFALN